MATRLIDRETFRRLADAALENTAADHAVVRMTDRVGGTTRFANNQIVQNVRTRRCELTVSVAFGSRTGQAATTEATPEAVQDAVLRAEQIARVAPEDPEYLPPLPPQRYPVLVTYRPETAEAGPQRRLKEAARAIGLCEAAGLQAAGIVATYTSAVGIAATSELFAYERRTRAEFSVTARGADSSGWARNANRSIDDLDIEALTRRAIDKARFSAQPRQIDAGAMPVILEPAAVIGLLRPLLGSLSARAYYRGTSALAGRLGTRIVDERLTLRNHPLHPALLGRGFNDYGLPTDFQTWVDHGVLVRLHYDRFTAREHGVSPTYALDAVVLEGDGAAGDDAEALIATTRRAILVTNFWYIRSVNPNDLTLTGMTRDGTFLVQDGQIACGVHNFRWHDSPLHALNRVDAFTKALDAVNISGGKMLLPALRLNEFNFTSVTRF